MTKFIKILFVLFALLCVFAAGVCASDFEEYKANAQAMGVDISLIGEENEAVNSENCENILNSLLSVDVSFPDEYVSVSEYLTVLLNHLGYDDFLYDFPFDKAAEVGILTTLPAGVNTVTYGMLLDYWNAFQNVATGGSNIVGLTNYFAPGSSENLVNRYYEGFGDFDGIESYKFEVFVEQGKGKYEVPANCEDKIAFAGDKILTGNIFSALSYAGEDITVSVKYNGDISEGYSVVSTEDAFDASFANKSLNISVSKPQILKVVFDSSDAKTLIIFVGDADTYSPNEITETLNNGISFDESTVKSENVSLVSPIKLCYGNIVSYVPYIVKNGEPYVARKAYEGDYSGSGSVIFEGCEYLPISAFENSVYDSQKGILYISSESDVEEVIFTSFIPLNDNSDISISGGAFSLSAKSDTDAFGAIAPIGNSNIYRAEILKFTADLQMTGNDKGVPIKISIIGYNDKGDADVIGSATVRAYEKEYATSSYLETAIAEEVYEGICFVVSCDATNATIDMVDPALEVFNISTGFGDNEINPF